jgi:NAD(P)-dependent dehydrogenase (short-subunit alcohol dehydrogenase family)
MPVPDGEPMARYHDLAGRVALVTGGSRGIGAATCRLLAANGVRVAVNGRDEGAVDALVAELAVAGADAAPAPGDATEWAHIEGMRERVERELGAVDILMPFAGGFDHYTPVQDITEAEWRHVIDANLTSTFLAVKAFIPGMLERRHGAIVTMASNAARLLDATLVSSYAAAKAGVVQFTRHVAREVGPRGVRVNCIAPATTLTDRIERNLSAEQRDALARLAPLERLGAPEDSAHAAVFLASDAASWLTGVTLDVTGGRVMA